jgi:hypothetical protein
MRATANEAADWPLGFLWLGAFHCSFLLVFLLLLLLLLTALFILSSHIPIVSSAI